MRIMRYAFGRAVAPKKDVNHGYKSNAQKHGMVMWDEIAAEVAAEFPDVSWDKMLVDAMTVRMTLDPQSLDTIVATNLHADILSDLAGAIAGSLGVAPRQILTQNERSPQCLSQFMVRLLISSERVLLIPLQVFGRPLKCLIIWEN